MNGTKPKKGMFVDGDVNSFKRNAIVSEACSLFVLQAFFESPRFNQHRKN
jgi:hypothetical protein